jgi:hypothetical protein
MWVPKTSTVNSFKNISIEMCCHQTEMGQLKKFTMQSRQMIANSSIIEILYIFIR